MTSTRMPATPTRREITQTEVPRQDQSARLDKKGTASVATRMSHRVEQTRSSSMVISHREGPITRPARTARTASRRRCARENHRSRCVPRGSCVDHVLDRERRALAIFDVRIPDVPHAAVPRASRDQCMPPYPARCSPRRRCALRPMPCRRHPLTRSCAR